MKLANEIAEKVLIDIHWQGKKSEHPADIKWLESRAGCLGREIAAKLEPVKKAVDAMMASRRMVDTEAWLYAEGLMEDVQAMLSEEE